MITYDPDELLEALGVVDVEYTQKMEDDVRDALVSRGYASFGRLLALSGKEELRVQSLQRLIRNYSHQTGHDHPLCMAVFGPPGSGKSFAVREMVEGAFANNTLKPSFATINLTQMSGPEALAEALSLAALGAEQNPGQLPVILFDEFDAPRGAEPLGWLAWFLAPMQDGEFQRAGRKVALRRAVYVFAGGTADSMDEFAQQCNKPNLRAAKGPDFLSRLRAYLDVAGPNDEPKKALRRAIVLRAALAKRIKNQGSGAFRVDPPVLESLLGGVRRYRHGARSLVALSEMLDLPPNSGTVGWEALPDKHLLALLIDRGPLDAQRLGGAVALTAFTQEDEQARDATEQCVTSVARALWDDGATLVYSGTLGVPSIQAVMRSLVQTLRSFPPEPARNEGESSHPRPWLRWFIPVHQGDSEPSSIESLLGPDLGSVGVEVVKRTYLAGDERNLAGTDSAPKARAIERFRRRLAASEASVARFAVGGQPETVTGERPSGVIEEVILTLALGKPIYLAGGFGGAAAELGGLLGLGGIRTGRIPGCLDRLPPPWLEDIAERLRPPPMASLPVTPDQQATFLKSRALGSRRWPDNGLSQEENRALFACEDRVEVARLVLKGLNRLFATPRPGGSS